jgi:hypothetical protein
MAGASHLLIPFNRRFNTRSLSNTQRQYRIVSTHRPNTKMKSIQITLVFSVTTLLVTFIHGACINETIVSTAGTPYIIDCGTDWPGNDLTHLPDISNLTDCINQCDEWNSGTPNQPITSFCVGAALVVYCRNTALLGCYVKGVMAGSGTIENNQLAYLVDSARRTTLNTVPYSWGIQS